MICVTAVGESYSLRLSGGGFFSPRLFSHTTSLHHFFPPQTVPLGVLGSLRTHFAAPHVQLAMLQLPRAVIMQVSVHPGCHL